MKMKAAVHRCSDSYDHNRRPPSSPITFFDNHGVDRTGDSFVKPNQGPSMHPFRLNMAKMNMTFDHRMEEVATEKHDMVKNALPQRQLKQRSLQILCAMATKTLQCQYAGISLRQDRLESMMHEKDDDDDDHVLVGTRPCVSSSSSYHHFLHREGKPKLVAVPAQMGLCDPIFATQSSQLVLDIKSKVTLHLREEKERVVGTRINTDSFEWGRLPIVRGPQKARFYAGAPVWGPGNQLLGALCVFDRTPRTSILPEHVTVMQHLANMIRNVLMNDPTEKAASFSSRHASITAQPLQFHVAPEEKDSCQRETWREDVTNGHSDRSKEPKASRSRRRRSSSSSHDQDKTDEARIWRMLVQAYETQLHVQEPREEVETARTNLSSPERPTNNRIVT
jgi:hypothetical protein